ncbi:hypothetical protein SAMN05216232_3650 [Virgibacillus subterraneus]|uniref:ARC6 IMS domain-containing protein n=1 Tax=Virgibacillus subterraneus TaxID=621109 RepID=A0A1H9JUY3_9BACI|nr:hypothetical protein [Virgibacillus subterraneus]SEQ90573.1 hypothetical protein SAMN05216232_3650 [Virgibacillus subterraneus]
MKERLNEFSKKSTLNNIDFSEESREQVMQQISKKSKVNVFSMWNKRILSAATLLLLLMVPAYITFNSLQDDATDPNENLSGPSEDSEVQTVEPEKPPLEDLDNQYESMVVQEYNEQLEVVNYDTKQELTDAFTEIMSQDLAIQSADQFFRVNNGELFVSESGGPALIDFDTEYNLTKISDKEYELTQTQESEFTGNIRLTVTYQYQEGDWIIADRNAESLDSQ